MSNNKLIERYFSNQLTKEDRLEFEELYKNDKTFKNELDFLENLKSITEDDDSSNFKAQLEGFEKEYQNTNKSANNKAWLKPLLAVAAVLVIALTINFGWNRSVDETKLFDTYIEPSKNVTQPIVRSDSYKNNLNNAFIAYNDSNYEEAVYLFENAYEDTKQSEILFYEGNALLAMGKPIEAIKKFNQHLTFSDSLTNRSHWYIALAYLKAKDIENAKFQFKLLMNSGESFKKEEASSIIKKLK